MPAVSVILLACNSGQWLQPALDSVLDQTMRDLEVIIVDNGSTDGAVDAALAHRPDARVKLVRHSTNIGIGAGTTSAVPLCTAPWIAIMDSDDRSHPMRFELQLKAAEADRSLQLIASDVIVIDGQDKPAGSWPACFVHHEMKQYAAYNMPLCHPTLMMRSEVMRALPYRAEFNIVADFDFISRAAERYKFGSVSLPLYYYRQHPASTTFSRMPLSESYACVVRLLTARRRAGRPEALSATLNQAAAIAAQAPNVGAIYEQWTRQCRAEGFPLLATFHAALAVRHQQTMAAQLRYLSCLLAAIRAQPGGWRAALGSLGKAPFWALLKEAGFPAFPRY